MFTRDFSSFKINPPALSPSKKATTFLVSHSSFIDSSIFAPSIPIALSYPALNRLITSARPSTKIIHGESNIAGPHGSFSFPYVVSLFEDVS